MWSLEGVNDIALFNIGKTLANHPVTSALGGKLIDELLSFFSVCEKLIDVEATLEGITFYYSDTEIYDNVQEELPNYRDAVENIGDDFSARIIAVESPVDMLLTTSDGSRVGALYENGKFKGEINEIEGAFYSGSTSEPELIVTPYSDENFVISLHGTDSGSYTLSTLLIDEGSVKSDIQTGVTANDEFTDFAVEVSASNIELKLLKSESEPSGLSDEDSGLPFGLSIDALLAIISVVVISIVGIVVFWKIRKKQ
jgi:hypothetical protein